uniref:Uncharacterized protein n=1 Tax=Coccolithus braarudii TaxID=221442 RepID=A0A7S0L5T7_9EUKA|mmetsp:Transcript_22129/g.47768  ORF Transcript_22129/g.47768 Transcript_22129/m.47768 type:complete len:282 (+) Transcript_22129:25-870(+)
MVPLLLLLAFQSARALRVSSILLDACNLQLHLEQEHKEALPTIASTNIDALPSKLLALVTVAAAPGITAVFDGAAFHYHFTGADWTLRIPQDEGASNVDCDGVESANLLRIRFTERLRKADDELVQLARAATEGGEPIRKVAASEALKALRLDCDAVVAVTRMRSLTGRRDRTKREAFLKSCGLPRVGDTAHMPSFTSWQRDRSINLVNGLHKLDQGTGAVVYHLIEQPDVVVATDDRGLRRKIMTLESPPAVLGRRQLFNWVESLDYLETEDMNLAPPAP